MSSDLLSIPRILIFNQNLQRDGGALLRSLLQALQAAKISMQHAIFCTDKLKRHGAERAGIVDGGTCKAKLSLKPLQAL